MSEEEITFGKVFQQDIVIRASNNKGCVVTSGCGTFVYSEHEKEKLARHLLHYLRNTKEITGRYNDSIDGLQPDPPPLEEEVKHRPTTR